MPFPGETFINSFGSALTVVADELRQYYALMQGFLSTEHLSDGTHGNIHAQSVTTAASGSATGAVTIGGTLDVTGTTTMRDALEIVPTNTPSTGLDSNGVTFPGTVISGGKAGVVGTEWVVTSAGTPVQRVTSIISEAITSDTIGEAVHLVQAVANAGSASIAVYAGIDSTLATNTGTIDIQADSVKVSSGLFERSRTTRMGEWTDVTFATGNFTATTGNWTLQSADQVTFAYALVGKKMTVVFEFDATDTSAITANLMVAIPGGFTAAKRTRTIIQTIDNGGAAQAGVAFVNATGTQINFQSTVAGAGWANTGGAANNTYVRGQITFPVS